MNCSSSAVMSAAMAIEVRAYVFRHDDAPGPFILVRSPRIYVVSSVGPTYLSRVVPQG